MDEKLKEEEIKFNFSNFEDENSKNFFSDIFLIIECKKDIQNSFCSPDTLKVLCYLKKICQNFILKYLDVNQKHDLINEFSPISVVHSKNRVTLFKLKINCDINENEVFQSYDISIIDDFLLNSKENYLKFWLYIFYYLHFNLKQMKKKMEKKKTMRLLLMMKNFLKLNI